MIYFCFREQPEEFKNIPDYVFYFLQQGAQDSCSHQCGELLGTCSCQVTCQSLGICCPDYKEFCLQISPYSGSLMGGKVFLIENTALNASSVLTCRWAIILYFSAKGGELLISFSDNR